MALFGLGKVKVEDVFERGQRGSGRIVGIEVRESSESESSIRVDEYAVEVLSSPACTAGVRQRLRPEVVRLGTPVAVRQLDGRVLIDWEATCGGSPERPLMIGIWLAAGGLAVTWPTEPRQLCVAPDRVHRWRPAWVRRSAPSTPWPVPRR